MPILLKGPEHPAIRQRLLWLLCVPPLGGIAFLVATCFWPVQVRTASFYLFIGLRETRIALPLHWGREIVGTNGYCYVEWPRKQYMVYWESPPLPTE